MGIWRCGDMRTSKEKDIFEDMQVIIGCTYISDLPFMGTNSPRDKEAEPQSV